MVDMPKEVIDALADFHSLKMVGTVNSAGVPNAVMIATVFPLDQKTLCFADLRLGKTKENILEKRKFTVTVLKLTLESYQIRCTFSGYEERGAIADKIGEEVYTKIKLQPRGIVIGTVDEVYSTSMGNPGAKLA
jgi:predicted pyridoxine 5'-phosphate oxidase superfamily flavin-nucleotide-binding protein